MKPVFYVGLHHPNHAEQFDTCMISVNVLEKRVSDIHPHMWILDSGAFTRIRTGVGHMPLAKYAQQIERWSKCGVLLAAVAQDYMCEPFILSITGLTIADHQRMTIENYVALRKAVRRDIYIMPVLQGYSPEDYVKHVCDYGLLLGFGAWVGVGSVCKRNGNPALIEAVLLAIKRTRPDLRLHGFGIKKTALASPLVNSLLTTCDSQAWSFAARREGRDANSPIEAHRYVDTVRKAPVQLILEAHYD